MIYQRIVFKCDECSDEIEVKLLVNIDACLNVPSLPDKWNRVNNKVYCNKHNIEIKDNE